MQVKLLYLVEYLYDDHYEKWGVYKGEITRDDFDLLALFKKSQSMTFGNGITTECVLMNHFMSEYPPSKWAKGDPLEAIVAFPEIREAVEKVIDEHTRSFTHIFGPEPELEGEYVYDYLKQFVKSNAANDTQLYRKWVLEDESRDASPERPVK
jgi:hypothetical protein